MLTRGQVLSAVDMDFIGWTVNIIPLIENFPSDFDNATTRALHIRIDRSMMRRDGILYASPARTHRTTQPARLADLPIMSVSPAETELLIFLRRNCRVFQHNQPATDMRAYGALIRLLTRKLT